MYRERAHMKNEKHLPIYGVGPLYVFVIAVLTLAAVLMRNMPFFSSGKLSVLRIPLLIAGVVFVAAGIALWIYAVPISKIDDGIKENRLVTTGAYALVRNPIYSAAMLVCTGVILLVGNACFFLLPLFYRLFMTVLMKATEEKWLEDLYGAEYRDYCRRVNRCWPWYFTELGCPELTKVFCKNDERTYGNLPGLKFERTGTLGKGAQRCDFLIRKV